MATDKPRFSLTLDSDTFDKLVSYKERHGFSTKSRAIQALVLAGLDDFEKTAEPVTKEKAPSILQDGDSEMLGLYHKLDNRDQGRVLGYMDHLLESEKYKEDAV